MTCRQCENLIPNWLNGRVSPRCVSEVAKHVNSCAACAFLVQEEAALRSAWSRTSVEAVPIDLWPRIAPRLTQRPQRASKFSRRSAWGWCAAAVFLCILFGGLAETPATVNSTRERTAQTGSSAATVPLPGAAGVAYATLADVPRVDPTVDDPARPSMEQIWVQLGQNSGTESGATSP
jgi:anti-sigma factor RsiW